MNAAARFVPSGLVLVDKPSGCTSFDVVAQIKRLFRHLKIGHAGTLDPLATGLLPVALGEATKLLSYLSATDKRYVATIALGQATDTLDAAGRETERKPLPVLSDKQIITALDNFKGEIMQVPPMYSAIHHQGRRLYELAREGIDVERKTRTVRIDTIEMIERGIDWIKLDIICSSGTYIRTLADEFARTLGTVGHIRELIRTEAAGYRLNEAIALEKLTRSTLADVIIPLEQVIARFLNLEVSAEYGVRLGHGHVLSHIELFALGLQPTKPQVICFRPVTKDLFVLARVETNDTGEVSMKILRVLYQSRPPAGEKHGEKVLT
jgi:tRNA pseudouridine55 synthase